MLGSHDEETKAGEAESVCFCGGEGGGVHALQTPASVWWKMTELLQLQPWIMGHYEPSKMQCLSMKLNLTKQRHDSGSKMTDEVIWGGRGGGDTFFFFLKRMIAVEACEICNDALFMATPGPRHSQAAAQLLLLMMRPSTAIFRIEKNTTNRLCLPVHVCWGVNIRSRADATPLDIPSTLSIHT